MSILEKAIDKYGKDNQLNMVQEECAELIQAISKYKRAIASKNVNATRSSRENIVEELADVMIMQEQLKIMLNITEFELMEYRIKKLTRLEERML